MLGNDRDPDGDDLRVEVVTGPRRGTLSLRGDGAFSYAHTAADDRDDEFTYRVLDPFGASATAVVTIVVAPANRPPSAIDDYVQTQEDVSVVFDVLANDSDPDGDPIEVLALGSVDRGAVAALGGGRVRYAPPLEWSGLARLTYTIGDGQGGEAAATVWLTVHAVNDQPQAEDDTATADDYRPIEIRVLDNDRDPEGDPLAVISVGTAESGTLEIRDGGVLLWTPRVGWVGTESVSYVATDGNGGFHSASVLLEVLPSALTFANQRAEAVGTPVLVFDTPEAQVAMPGISLSPQAGVRLLTDALFQSLEILRFPLALLAAALLWALTLGGLLNLGGAGGILALLFPSRRRRTWAVVMLTAEHALTACQEPDASSHLVHNFGATYRGIESTGKPKKAGGTLWMPVETPQGRGWVDAAHLTEEVDSETFADDARPQRLAEQLAVHLESGRSLGSLLGRRGLTVSYTTKTVAVTREEISRPRADDTVRLWRAGDGIYPPVIGTFRDAVAEPFVATYRSPAHEVKVDSPVLASALIPTQFRNFHFISVGAPGRLNSWMIYFEYRRGKARIVALGVDG